MKQNLYYYLNTFKSNALRNIYRHTVKPVIFPILKRKNISRVNRCKNEIKKFKGVGNGKRCFVIGNGPSLTVKDLEKIKNEVSFGTNRIYEIFSGTDWRPTYYCVQDYEVIVRSKSRINEEISANKFVGLSDHAVCPSIDNAIYYKIISEEYYPELPKFSDNAEECIYAGNTVTYACMQLAVYMGFKEIILLGVDHSFSMYIDENGNLVKQDGVQDHFAKKGGISDIPRLDCSTLAYKAARKFADEHGIKIYNATRGGRLEVFERVDFDKLFKEK